MFKFFKRKAENDIVGTVAEQKETATRTKEPRRLILSICTSIDSHPDAWVSEENILKSINAGLYVSYYPNDEILFIYWEGTRINITEPEAIALRAAVRRFYKREEDKKLSEMQAFVDAINRSPRDAETVPPSPQGVKFQ